MCVQAYSSDGVGCLVHNHIKVDAEKMMLLTGKMAPRIFAFHCILLPLSLSCSFFFSAKKTFFAVNV